MNKYRYTMILVFAQNIEEPTHLGFGIDNHDKPRCSGYGDPLYHHAIITSKWKFSIYFLDWQIHENTPNQSSQQHLHDRMILDSIVYDHSPA